MSWVENIVENLVDIEQKFIVNSYNEVCSFIKSIIKSKNQVTAIFDNNENFILTTVIAINEKKGTIIIDIGALPETNNKILHAKKIIFVTKLNDIKVQFAAENIESITHEGLPAFSIKIPTVLFRFQKREYYRTTLDINHNINFNLDINNKSLKMKTLDISIGGIAATINDITNIHEFEIGNIFLDVPFIIPNEAYFTTSIRVRNILDIKLLNGKSSKRIGFEFIDLKSSYGATILKFINKTDREKLSKS